MPDHDALAKLAEIPPAGSEEIFAALRDARLWVEAATAPIRHLSPVAAAPGEDMLRRIDAALAKGAAPLPPAPAQEGSSPAVSHGEAVGELEWLSKAATWGRWHLDQFPFYDMETGESQAPRCEGICTHNDDDGLAEEIAACSEADAAFIVALVNAYRSGHLVPAPLAPALVGEGSEAGAAPCHWGGGNDIIWCSTCGEEYAYAKGEDRPPCPRATPTPDPVTAARAVLDDWLQPPSRENAEIQALRAVCMIQARELKLLSPDGKTPADLDDAMAALATLYAHQENEGEVRDAIS